METRASLLQELDATISQLLTFYHNLADHDLAVSEGWSARDVLAHITFWHESFARNVWDLVNDTEPTPVKGTFKELNQQGVEQMRQYALEHVLERLGVAHTLIQTNILNPKLIMIPYRKGSRDYTPEEHLELVNRHIKQHVREIKAAARHVPVAERAALSAR